jgi:ribosomal protein L11 methylase PrmA
VVVVIATTEPEVARLRARLVTSGASGVEVRRLSVVRTLVIAAVADEGDAERFARTLRSEGELAVARPDGGARLEAWMRHSRPVTFGDRLTIRYAWSEHPLADDSRLIELGPGGFGNGDHPSTRLVVEQLMARVRGGERVLDVGCGSGVLGLCALALGAAGAIGIDIDADAIDATRRNAALNGMQAQMTATSRRLGEVDGPFDIVVANVGRGALVELASALVPLLAPNGWLAVSGISPPQGNLVAGFLRPLVVVDEQTDGEWSAVVLAHSAPAVERRDTSLSGHVRGPDLAV